MSDGDFEIDRYVQLQLRLHIKNELQFELPSFEEMKLLFENRKMTIANF